MSTHEPGQPLPPYVTRETGRQRATRIPLDYFKRPDALTRWKGWLSLLALLVAGGWAVSGLVRSDQGRLSYSRGPVAAVHAAWDSDCAACHVDFSPMSRQNFLVTTFGRGQEAHKLA